MFDPADEAFEGFLLDLDVQFHNAGLPEFAPPIEFALFDEVGYAISGGVMFDCGRSSLFMNFAGRLGGYKSVSNKKFSTNVDKKNLVAQLKSISIRRGDCDNRM